jgi:hypothetical protein
MSVAHDRRLVRLPHLVLVRLVNPFDGNLPFLSQNGFVREKEPIDPVAVWYRTNSRHRAIETLYFVRFALYLFPVTALAEQCFVVVGTVAPPWRAIRAAYK